jgi:hypothetical protein
MSLIFKVIGLEDALWAVKLHSGLILDGNILGYKPMTP